MNHLILSCYDDDDCLMVNHFLEPITFCGKVNNYLDNLDNVS